MAFGWKKLRALTGKPVLGADAKRVISAKCTENHSTMNLRNVL